MDRRPIWTAHCTRAADPWHAHLPLPRRAPCVGAQRDGSRPRCLHRTCLPRIRRTTRCRRIRRGRASLVDAMRSCRRRRGVRLEGPRFRWAVKTVRPTTVIVLPLRYPGEIEITDVRERCEFMLSGSEHRASAALRSTTTCIKPLDRCASTTLDRQLIVNKQLFPFVNGSKRNRDRYTSLQTQTDKFITRFVIVFASAIALLADRQTASQIIFFCHRCKSLSVHVDT
jgi:hypothetical protein